MVAQDPDGVIARVLTEVIDSSRSSTSLHLWRTRRTSQRVALSATALQLDRRVSDEHAPYFYLPRPGAFVTLIVGIVDKNRRASRTSDVERRDLSNAS